MNHRLVRILVLGAVLLLSACGDGAKEVLEQIARGKALIAEGKFEAAITELKRATEADRNAMQAWLQLGHAYAGLKRYDDALAAYVAAKRVDRHTIAPHLAHAKVQIALGNISFAILELTLVTEMDPKNLEALKTLGRISQLPHKQSDGTVGVARLDLERAELNLEAATILAPQDMEAKSELAKVRTKLEQFKKPGGQK